MACRHESGGNRKRETAKTVGQISRRRDHFFASFAGRSPNRDYVDGRMVSRALCARQTARVHGRLQRAHHFVGLATAEGNRVFNGACPRLCTGLCTGGYLKLRSWRVQKTFLELDSGREF